MSKKWIAEVVRHKGALRRTAGVKKGETISDDELDELSEKPGVTGRRARLSQNLKHIREK